MSKDSRTDYNNAIMPPKSKSGEKTGAPPSTGSIATDLPTINLGKLEINAVRECYFIIRNEGFTTTNFKIIQPDAPHIFIFKTECGSIAPQGSLKVMVDLFPIRRGKQSHHFLVECIEDRTKIRISFELHGVISSYLRCTDLCDNIIDEINFGYCFIDPSKKFTEVFALKVSNIGDQALFVNITSNLAQQFLVFYDEALEILIDSFSLLVNDSKILYLAIQPYGGGSSNGKKNLALAQNTVSEVRNLVGGLKFHIRDDNDQTSVVVGTHVVKFRAITGQSLIEVINPDINLGTCFTLTEEFQKELVIYNKTPSLPMHFQLLNLNSWIRPEVLEGKLEPTDSFNKESFKINIKVKALKYGLLKDSITVNNLYNSQQQIMVDIRLFVDPNILVINGIETPISDTLDWKSIYIYPGFDDSKKYEIITSSSSSKGYSFKIRNKSEELVELYPKSNLALNLTWSVAPGDGFIMEHCDSNISMGVARNGLLSCGFGLMLHPRQAAVAVVDTPSPMFYTEGMDSTNVVQRTGILTFETPKNETLQVLTLNAAYCESVGVLDKSEIDIGQIGHAKSWEPSYFTFTITNLSQIPLWYNIACPACILIHDSDGVVFDLEHAQIEPSGSISYHGLLKARLIEDLSIGDKRFEIFIHNIYNPNNSLRVLVKAILTLPEIRIERLHNNSIFFDSIAYPWLPSSSTSDFCFYVVNLSHQEKKVEFSPQISPDIVDLLELTTLIRSSNAVVTGPITISPNRGEEIKIKAGLKLNAKLSKHEPRCEWIFSKSEITLGSLQVSTFDGMVDDEKQIAESIRIYGSFIEKSQFDLSLQNIRFRTFPMLNNVEEFLIKEQEEDFTITNLSSYSSLDLKVKIDLPMEISSDAANSVIRISSLDDKMMVSIDPNSFKVFKVNFVDTKRDGLSENIRIQIVDMNSIQMTPKIIEIGIDEEVLPPNVETDLLLSNVLPVSASVDMLIEDSLASDLSHLTRTSTQTRVPSKNSENLAENEIGSLRRRAPILILRGCKRVSDMASVGILKGGGLFLLDLGQQDIGLNSVIKKLYLENPTREKVSYCIKTLEKEVHWLYFSQTNGVFEGFPVPTPNEKEMHVINVSVVPTVRGSYSTYILLENLMNPADFKIIKVVMDIVSSQNIRRTVTESVIVSETPTQHTAFDVYVSGFSSEISLIEIDDVYFDETDSTKSLVIQNNESVPLEFVLNSSIVSPDDGEIIFSVYKSK